MIESVDLAMYPAVRLADQVTSKEYHADVEAVDAMIEAYRASYEKAWGPMPEQLKAVVDRHLPK